jgi:hypothetical protein
MVKTIIKTITLIMVILVISSIGATIVNEYANTKKEQIQAEKAFEQALVILETINESK